MVYVTRRLHIVGFCRNRLLTCLPGVSCGQSNLCSTMSLSVTSLFIAVSCVYGPLAPYVSAPGAPHNFYLT